MKRLFKTSLIALALSVALCGCSSNDGNSKDYDAYKNFKDMMSFDDIMDDVKKVDLFLEPDYSNLTEKVEKDDEAATAIKYYYDGDALVYAKYEGYGEDSFDYYTKSESGRDLTVKYVDENSERYSVDVSCDDYCVSFLYLEKKCEYDARHIIASAEIAAENDLPKTVTYVYDNGETYISNGYYYAEDGYHSYYSIPIDGDNNMVSDDIVKYAKVDSVNVNKDIPSYLDDERIIDSEIVVGEHTIEYTENADGSKNWYVVADVYAVFDSEDKAVEFAKEYNLDYNVSNTDDTIFMSWFEKVTLPISDSYEDFLDFAMQEVNDYYYCSLVFDEDGNIKDLNPATAKMSYY